MGINLRNEHFGFLEVIGPQNTGNWLCQCRCGKVTTIKEEDLLKGRQNNCGCLNHSLGELQIEQILRRENLYFQKEYRPQNHQLIKGLRFDFYVDTSFFIEFDGPQHYIQSNPWFYIGQAKNDMRKNKYCIESGIPLYRIPYDYLNKMTYQLITSEHFRVVKENHYNIIFD